MPSFQLAQQQDTAPSVSDTDYAFWAHMAAAIASFFSVGLFLPLFAPFIVLMLTPSRHRFLMFHLNQTAFFQLFMHGVMLVMTLVISVIAFFTCGVGVVLFLLLVIPWLIGIIVPVMHAFRARNGEWSQVPWIGKYVYEMERPFFT